MKQQKTTNNLSDNSLKSNSRSKNNILLVAILILFFLVFLTILILLATKNNALLNNDFDVASLFEKNRNDFLNLFFVIMSIIGGTKFIAIASVFLLILPNRKKIGIPLLFAVVVSAILNLFIKIVVARARPVGFFESNLPLGYAFPDGYSFPSGHAQTATVFYVVLGYLINKNYIKNKYIKILLWVGVSALCFSISFARIYLGVHFLSDVIAGLALAGILISGFIILDKNFNLIKLINSY